MAAKRIGRALLLRCPRCGAPGIVRGWFEIVERCPQCGLRFEREEGYYTGAMGITLVLAMVLFFVGFVVAFALTFSNPPVVTMMIAGAAFMVVFPLLFWPFGKTLWIALDLTLHPVHAGRGAGG